MYNRTANQRAASYSSAQHSAAASSATHKSLSSAHSTSSAFSASANPNEDWTKMSDLAERRRVQNRIAQRNYRKKLKKRLEDLEKRAASDSMSPEPKPSQPARRVLNSMPSPSSSSYESTVSSLRRRGVEIAGNPDGNNVQDAQPYVVAGEDRSMFLEQYTRQISTSPPPFSYGFYCGPPNSLGCAAYAQPSAYYGAPSYPMDRPLFPPTYSMIPGSYPPSTSSATPSTPIKTEVFGDDEMNPFVSAYALMAGVDVSQYHTADKRSAHASPLLCASIERPCPEEHSPTDSSLILPLTPESWLSSSPLLGPFDDQHPDYLR